MAYFVDLERGVPRDQGILGRLRHHAQVQPDAIALRDRHGGISYGELVARVRHYADQIAEKSHPNLKRIGILAENTPEYLVCFLGIVASGRCAVTLPALLTTESLRKIVSDADCGVIFADSAYATVAEALRDPAGAERDVTQFLPQRAGNAIESMDAEPFAGESGDYPDSEFNIVYSSGTTGTPKGIVHTHRSRAVMAAGFSGLGMDTAATTLVSTPLYTNMSIPAFLGTLWGGGCTLIAGRFNPEDYLRISQEFKATHFFLVPDQVKRLFESPEFGKTDLSSSQLVYVAGSFLSPELKLSLLRLWPGVAVEVYGISEGAPYTAHFLTDETACLDHSVGNPPNGVRMAVLDPKGKLLGPGEIGELIGQSGNMMLGYNNRPDAMQELIWKDANGSIYFRSGDLGCIDESGKVHLKGRLKEMIISGGLNIYASDVEEVLNRHGQVAECAVIAAPSERWGESPFGFVVLRAASELDEQEILNWANSRLSKYQQLAGISIIESLPRNTLGKVVKPELKRLLAKT
ncbi:MAG: class I adenylate-forming enzyme family protein [Steroidobacteraceae bacterium]